MPIAHYAIKTSGGYTVVTVDSDANECTVESVDPRLGPVSVSGIDRRAIQLAATLVSGKSYGTLRELHAAA